MTSDKRMITTGYDEWGYNYEAHIFNGTYCDAYRDATWCQAYADDELIMKWNDPWLSNKDCDFDDNLDRHYGYDTYKGSGAWLTNHMAGKVEVNGKLRKWTYFVKIVAVEPTDICSAPNPTTGACPGNGTDAPVGYWLRDGVEIGPAIWNEFAVIEVISNDPSAGAHGKLYKSPISPGFGVYGTNP